MKGEQLLEQIWYDLKLLKLDQLISRFTQLEAMPLSERKSLIDKQQGLKQKCASDGEHDFNFVEFVFMYLSWTVEEETTNMIDAFPKFSIASDKLRLMLKAMGPQHSSLMRFVGHFIKVMKGIQQRAFAQAKEQQKEEKKFTDDLLADYQKWISLINKEMKDDKCSFKGSIMLPIYNQQLRIFFSKYMFSKFDEIEKNTKDRYGFRSDNLNSEPKSSQVVFIYYFGRFHFFKQNYAQAREHLEYALNLVPEKYFKQRRQILKYLIPINIFFGKFASHSLIDKYHLLEYADLIAAIESGDLHKFDQSYHRWKKIWIKRSLYLFVCSLEQILIRNLFKRVIHLLAHFKTERSFNIDIKYFKTALEFSKKKHYDTEEVACILGSLFNDRKLLRGNIIEHNNTTFAVLSVKDPCPRIDK